eukprot:scaffold98125_cov63-Phaeocystis_antarctica.AAC.1
MRPGRVVVASAVSTSAPVRPPPSPAAAEGTSRTTTSASKHTSEVPVASQSTRAAPLRSLACVPGPLHPARRGLPPPPQRRTRLAHTPRPTPLQSKVWYPPPHTAPPACSSLSVCSRPMHRRTMATTAFAVSTSAPVRPPPSPAAAYRASRMTTSAPAHNSSEPVASQSTRAAPLRSLACVPGPLHPARRGLSPQRRTHAPDAHRRPLRCGARHHTAPPARSSLSECFAQYIAGHLQQPHPEGCPRYASVAAVPLAA